jgi:hypothetical protein
MNQHQWRRGSVEGAMRGTVVVVVAAGIIGCLLAGEQSAWANDEEDALVRRAIALRKHGNDRAALDELQRAYLIAHSPRAAAQLGFVEQALGLLPQADDHVRETLAAGSDPWIRKNRATLKEAQATIRAHVGRVHIEGGEPGAQVTVNGQSVGSIPLRDAIPVSAGPVDIEVRAAGHLPALKTVNVAAGEYTRVPFTLQPVAPPRPQTRPVPAPRAALSPPVTPLIAPAVGPDPLPTETQHDAGRGRRIAGIGVVAGGVAAIGGGVAASVVGKNKFDAIGADAAADRPYNESNGNWKSYETAAAALYVVGGVAVVGGVVLYMAGRPRAEERRPPAVSSIALRPVVLPSRAGATLSVRF